VDVAPGHPCRRAGEPADRPAPEADEDRRGGRLYPVAIGTDAIVYPSPGPSPLEILPLTDEGKPVPGTFRLGVSPGMVKHQGTQTSLWAESQFEERGGVFNVANLIKTDQSAGEGE
jgi:hypothetical protein